MIPNPFGKHFFPPSVGKVYELGFQVALNPKPAILGYWYLILDRNHIIIMSESKTLMYVIV
ncbi:hypothetical protein Hanom_Chr02g00146451 [Helianthus anomalus]